jgi:hypothetical protein
MAEGDRTQTDLDGEFRPVGSSGPEIKVGSHLASLRRRVERRPVSPVGFPTAVGDQRIHSNERQGRTVVTEHDLGGAVGKLDVPALVDHQDGVGGQLDDDPGVPEFVRCCWCGDRSDGLDHGTLFGIRRLISGHDALLLVGHGSPPFDPWARVAARESARIWSRRLAEMPPQMPWRSSCSRAHPRQSVRTGHVEQMATASVPPSCSTGNHSVGSWPRQRANCLHGVGGRPRRLFPRCQLRGPRLFESGTTRFMTPVHFLGGVIARGVGDGVFRTDRPPAENPNPHRRFALWPRMDFDHERTRSGLRVPRKARPKVLTVAFPSRNEQRVVRTGHD